MKRVAIYNTQTGAIKAILSGDKNIQRAIEKLGPDEAWKHTDIKSPSGWAIENGVEVVREPVVDQEARLKKLRRMAYQVEADPLFFKWQRGEATEAEYRAKVEEIRLRYQYPTPVA